MFFKAFYYSVMFHRSRDCVPEGEGDRMRKREEGSARMGERCLSVSENGEISFPLIGRLV